MRDFSYVKRIVVKVGTNLLTTKDGIDETRIEDIARQIAELRNLGKQVLLVSSGAIGMGAKKLGHKNAVVHIPLRQACAAIGQPLLMSSYEKAFARYGIITSQVLITRSVLNNRTSYNNLRSSVSTLLALGVVPIFNENDVVSTSEIGNVFGDNDRMSALVASKIDADLLVLLTDIDGLYTANPKTDDKAVFLPEISKITDEIMSYARGKGSTFSTGGMKTKLLAARIAKDGGCGTIIASGYVEDSLIRIIRGEEVGSYILPANRLSQRERWILNTPACGAILVDDGARKALLSHKSLLPSGIVEVEGEFTSGEVVLVKDLSSEAFLKAVTSLSSSELRLVKGLDSRQAGRILDKGGRLVVFRPEDTSSVEHDV